MTDREQTPKLERKIDRLQTELRIVHEANKRFEARLAKVPALAKWTQHHSACARRTEASECDCGLNDAWRDLGSSVWEQE